jgi:hypothetical protein
MKEAWGWIALFSYLCIIRLYLKISAFMNKMLLLFVLVCNMSFCGYAQWASLGGGNEANQVKRCNAFVVSLDGRAYAGYNNQLLQYAAGQWTTILPAGFPNITVVQLVAAPDSSVYAGCIDLNDGQKAIVLQYKNNTWTKLGASLSNTVSNKISITFGLDGTPYALYSDSVNNFPFASVPCYAKKFMAGNWTMVGNGRVGTGLTSAGLSIAVDAADDPFASIGSNQLKRLRAGAWTDITPALFFGKATLLASPSRRKVYLCGQFELYEFEMGNDFGQIIEGPTPPSQLTNVVMRTDSNLVVLDSGRSVHQYTLATQTWTKLGGINNWPDASAIALDRADIPHLYWPNLVLNYGVVKLTATGWETLGNGGISGGLSQNSRVAVGPQQVPYVLFDDFKNGGATVMQWINNSWQTLGVPGSLPISGDVAVSPTGVVYVSGKTGNDQRLTVRKWEGGNWVLVGTANFSPAMVDNNELAFSANGTVYIGFTHYNTISTQYDVSVMKLENNNWANVGAPGFYGGGTNFFTFAVAPDGTPYVGFGDVAVSGLDATVMRYRNTSWSFVGGQGFSNVDRSMNMAIATNGTPYYTGRNTAASNRISVLRYNDTAWVNVGPASFSTGSTLWTKLAISADNKLVVAYYDRTENGIISKKFVNNNWVQLGGVISLNGLDLEPSIYVAPNNADLYVAYNVSGTYVKRFTAFDSSLRLCPGGSTELQAGTPAMNYQWQVNTGSGFVNIADNNNYMGSTTGTLQLMAVPGSFYGHQYRCLRDGVPGPVHVLKLVATWIGGVDNRWANPSNWQCGVVPDQFADVEINAGSIVVDTNAICRTLTLNPSVSYTVLGGFTLTVVQ